MRPDSNAPAAANGSGREGHDQARPTVAHRELAERLLGLAAELRDVARELLEERTAGAFDAAVSATLDRISTDEDEA